jgi:hypothetical protein
MKCIHGIENAWWCILTQQVKLRPVLRKAKQYSFHQRKTIMNPPQPKHCYPLSTDPDHIRAREYQNRSYKNLLEPSPRRGLGSMRESGNHASGLRQ